MSPKSSPTHATISPLMAFLEQHKSTDVIVPHGLYLPYEKLAKEDPARLSVAVDSILNRGQVDKREFALACFEAGAVDRRAVLEHYVARNVRPALPAEDEDSALECMTYDQVSLVLYNLEYFEFCLRGEEPKAPWPVAGSLAADLVSAAGCAAKIEKLKSVMGDKKALLLAAKREAQRVEAQRQEEERRRSVEEHFERRKRSEAAAVRRMEDAKALELRQAEEYMLESDEDRREMNIFALRVLARHAGKYHDALEHFDGALNDLSVADSDALIGIVNGLEKRGKEASPSPVRLDLHDPAIPNDIPNRHELAAQINKERDEEQEIANMRIAQWILEEAPRIEAIIRPYLSEKNDVPVEALEYSPENALRVAREAALQSFASDEGWSWFSLHVNKLLRALVDGDMRGVLRKYVVDVYERRSKMEGSKALDKGVNSRRNGKKVDVYNIMR